MPEETSSVQSSNFTMAQSLRKGIPFQKTPETIYEETSYQGDGSSFKPVPQADTVKPVSNTPGIES